jgi:hypothetical protein
MSELEYLDFKFYKWFKYRGANDKKDYQIKQGQWLCIAHDVGSALTQRTFILSKNQGIYDGLLLLDLYNGERYIR